MNKIYFVGAGPGDPDLITVKGLKLLEQADIIIYTDSLVSEELTKKANKDATIVKSSGMVLEELVELMAKGSQEGKKVVRLHTGDPSVYGAIYEQIELLQKEGIQCEVVPGVSSVFAAAAALGAELTIPELTQTVILTRADGRTPVPEREKLSSLASHHATLAIFLSATLAEKVSQELLDAGWDKDTPIAIVQKASHPDQLIVRTTVGNLPEAMRENNIKSTAMILAGNALDPSRINHKRVSKLYDKGFTHGFRKGVK
ncbi:MAG: precorrin-4 C(11)-methyltransferase [Leptospirales bacterium]